MEKLATLTEDELLHISAITYTRLEDFVKSPRLNNRELASLSHDILKEMGRESNMMQGLIMMQVLKQLREQELKGANQTYKPQ